MQNSVCAVIVTYRPTPEHAENVAKVFPQVEQVVVVDNASSEDALAPFVALQQRLGFQIIRNRENVGITGGINIGAKWAKAQGYEWVILFDQDSTVTEGFIASMLASYHADQHPETIGTIVPKYIDRFSDHEMPLELGKDGEVLTVLTSGSLIPVSVFDKCGWFRDDFFMDQHDYEFSLRLRSRGFRMLQDNNAVLMHELGIRRRHTIGGRYFLTSNHYSPLRVYYVVRNRMCVMMLYWRKYPTYCFRLIKLTFVDSIKIVLVEEMKLEKLKNLVRGLWDGLTGRMGNVLTRSSSSPS